MPAGPGLARRLLRPALLEGRAIAVAAGGDAPFQAAVADALGSLGAAVAPLAAADPLDEPAVEEAVAGALAGPARLDGVVIDAAGGFGMERGGAGPGAAGAGGVGAGAEPVALRAALDAAWFALRAVVRAAFIPAGGGQAVLLAPRPAAGPHAPAARAALENLARTASIEWSRHAVRTVAVTPGAATTPAEVAALAAYLCSPAGEYFSGCRLALGEIGPTPT